MAITLPTCPPVASYTPRLVSARNDLTPAFGGPVTREVRAGARWAFDIELAPMEYATFMLWNGLEAEADTVVWTIPQPGESVSGEGTPLVQGGSQTGSTVLIDGLTVGYTIKAGRWISIITSSQRYLYQVTGDVTANGSGVASVTIRPSLRVSPADNDVVEVTTPKIEGFVRAGSVNGQVLNRYKRQGGHLKGLSFTIEERQ